VIVTPDEGVTSKVEMTTATRQAGSISAGRVLMRFGTSFMRLRVLPAPVLPQRNRWIRLRS
jgi:hypothetical protein